MKTKSITKKQYMSIYLIIYRTGSKSRFKWFLWSDIFTYFGFKKKQAELKRKGYRVIGVSCQDFEKIGFPKSFAGHEYLNGLF